MRTMLTKYKIKLEKDGLTIMQWVEPGASSALPSFLGDNSLKETFDESKEANAASNAGSPAVGGSSAESPGEGGGRFTGPGAGGSSAESPGEGGEFPGSATAAPITIIGPIIYMCCPCHNDKKENEG
jgi:hypothetical protein